MFSPKVIEEKLLNHVQLCFFLVLNYRSSFITCFSFSFLSVFWYVDGDVLTSHRLLYNFKFGFSELLNSYVGLMMFLGKCQRARHW